MTEAAATRAEAPDCAICAAIKALWVRAGPVLVVVAVIILGWYLACIPLNRAWAEDRAGEALSLPDLVPEVWAQDRPVLPAPHQVGAELWATTALEPPLRERRGELRGNPRSLLYHAWQTLAPTLLGFLVGAALGVVLAVGIVHNRAMDLGVMPWAVASQMVPILAIAPMIIVVMASLGIQGLWPKSLISAYLSFFPVVVSMVKGLRSPSRMDLDLLATYSASPAQVLWRLRLPVALPFLFAALKIAIAAALVGAIVAELPTGARFGLGARLLSGSYYGQTIQIWSALFMAAISAALLVGLVGRIERGALSRMGMAR